MAPTVELVQQIFAALPQSNDDRAALRFVAVPGDSEPRWLLPWNSGDIDSVLANWTPYRGSSRLKWSAVRAAARLRATHILPHCTRVELDAGRSIDWRALGWESTDPPAAVIYIGTPGPSRKAVVHLVDQQSGNCDLVVKTPLADEAGKAILREAHILTALAEQKQQKIRAPQLLHRDQGHGITSQQFIAGSPGDRRLASQHFGLLGSLLLEGETTTIASHAAALSEDIKPCAITATRLDLLHTALAGLRDARLLPACWVHGDFAPWNIRECEDGGPMLIDWEDAHRGGLPLHDAYHFLHIQDFLFGHRPRLHWPDLDAYARTLGLASEQCRQLEIAYLAHASLRRVSQNAAAHSSFLFETLSIATRTRSCDTFRPGASLPAAASAEKIESQVRKELFATVIAQFNAARVRYCVLSGDEELVGSSDSDVDFMLHPDDLRQAQDLLAKAADVSDGHVVQAISYETDARYFVLAKYSNPHIAYLKVDCCGDYRRGGRLWLRAADILGSRGRWKEFFVPSVSHQFLYYLIKKILKQSLTLHQFKRLHHLYARSPGRCIAAMTRFWSRATATQLERALIEQNLPRMQSRLPELLTELEFSNQAESGFDRVRAILREYGRRLRRAVRPSGMVVMLTGGDLTPLSHLAAELSRRLLPAFRRTKGLTLTSLLALPSLIHRVLLDRRRSTLVIVRARESFGWLAMARVLFRPDLIIRLCERSAKQNISSSIDVPTPAVLFPSDVPADQVLQNASRAILDWLAARQAKRAGWHKQLSDDEPQFSSMAEPAKVTPAGLD